MPAKMSSIKLESYVYVKLFFNFDQIYLYFWHSLGSAVMRDANLEQFNSLAGARGDSSGRIVISKIAYSNSIKNIRPVELV